MNQVMGLQVLFYEELLFKFYSLNYLVTSNIRLVIQDLASLNYSSYFSKFRISESSVAVFMCSIVIDFT